MMMAACRTPSPMAPRRETQRKPTTRTISVIVLVVMVVCPEAGLSSVAGKFGHRSLGAVVVDECLAGGSGGDQGGDGGVVQRAGQAQAGLVQSRNRIVGNQRIGPPGQSQVVLQVP